MSPSGDAVTLAILAGGEASRLGGFPKGLLELEGRPIVARLLDLAPAFEDVLIVTGRPAPYRRFGRCLPDLVPGRGPSSGIHAALAQASTPWVLAVAADMPFVRLPVVERLLAERGEGVEAAVFRVGDRLEPLLGLYRADRVPAWEEALGAGLGPSQLLERLRTRVLPEEALRALDPSLLSVVSVNHPEDARRYGLRIPKDAATMS